MYFRIQEASRNPIDLIDPDHGQISYSWAGPESYDRPGVSVCGSFEELISYLAQTTIPFGYGEWVIVELDGDEVEDVVPMDAEVGEILVWPTEIISVRPVDDAIFELIGDAYDALQTM